MTTTPSHHSANDAALDAVERDQPENLISAVDLPRLALDDLMTGLRRHNLWWSLAAHDIRQRFRRSILGPFWITLSMGVMVGALAIVFGSIFQHDTKTFVPYVAVGLIFWNLIVATVNESCLAYVASEGFVRNVPMPLSVHFYRVFVRNCLVCAFNMVIYVVVFLIFMREVNVNFLLIIPGLVLFTVNLAWVSFLVAILSTRFRDIPQLINSLLQVVFFVTPIFWSPDQFPSRPVFIDLNPIYHLIEIVRAPLLGQAVPLETWAVTMVMAAFGSALAIFTFTKAYSRLPYWV